MGVFPAKLSVYFFMKQASFLQKESYESLREKWMDWVI